MLSDSWHSWVCGMWTMYITLHGMWYEGHMLNWINIWGHGMLVSISRVISINIHVPGNEEVTYFHSHSVNLENRK